jgi:hypothetical protein
MLFMVIETFKNQDAQSIYHRLKTRGRTLPEGIQYIDSWVEASLQRCFQLMECQDLRALQEWVVQWKDLIEFEIIPVLTSQEAQQIVMRNLKTDTRTQSKLANSHQANEIS